MYFITPSFSVAFNAKVASSTLSRAIIRDFWPEVDSRLKSAAYPKGSGPDAFPAHSLCPSEASPSKPVVLVIREPVERFRSGMAQRRLEEVDAVLDALETGSESVIRGRRVVLADEVTFSHQHKLASPAARVFRLDDLDAAASFIGLSLPLPVINEATREKPALTPEQEARVLAYYAEDKALYDAIPAGGMDYTYTPPAPPTGPATVPGSITATQIRLWLVRNGISMKQVSAAIAAIPNATARAEAEVLWEYAPYVERTNPLVGVIASGFGMSESAVDQAFREAAGL